MNCIEARRLIEGGVVPGARTALSTQLGFHLARCVACRAYRKRHDALLAMLLLDTQPPTRTPALLPVARRQHSSLQLTRVLWQLSLCLLLSVPLVLLGLLLWIGGIAVRTQQNIAAMIVTPAPSVSSGGSMRRGLLAVAPPLVSIRQATLAVATPMPASTPTATASASAVANTPTAWPTLQPIVPSATAVPLPTLPPPTVQPTLPPPTVGVRSGDAISVLLLGNDRRPGEQGVPRTDAVMLARIDTQRSRVALLSLPRDLWVTIPGYGETRLNAAYVWGEVYHASGGGMGLARESVSALIGVPIDYVVMVDFEGFVGAIDSIGGITVNVDKELYDAQFPTMDYGYTAVHFLPGPQHMDGVTALNYSRIRHPDNDFVRIKRQQAVLIGLGERLRERGDLQNLLAADTITAALRAYVHTDMPQERLLETVWALRMIDARSVERYALDADSVSFGVGNDPYAELPIPGALEALVQQWYGP